MANTANRADSPTARQPGQVNLQQKRQDQHRQGAWNQHETVHRAQPLSPPLAFGDLKRPVGLEFHWNGEQVAHADQQKDQQDGVCVDEIRRHQPGRLQSKAAIAHQDGAMLTAAPERPEKR